MSQMLPSLIRTYVPLGVSFLVSWLLTLGIPVNDNEKALVISGFSSIIAAAYYAGARVLERRFPWATVLLGSSVQPTNYAPAATDATATGAAPDPDPGHVAVADAAGVLVTPETSTPPLTGRHYAPGGC